MPYFKTSQEWLEQSTLLLEARPATTRITTRYSIKPAPSRSKGPDTDGDTKVDDASAAGTAKPPRGSLEIKTYDPVSGVTLKYRTTKAAEVSRLIYSSLGQLGRGMAALPIEKEEAMPDAGAADGAETPGGAQGQGAEKQPQQQPQQQQGGGGAGGGGGKKKKKGKR